MTKGFLVAFLMMTCLLQLSWAYYAAAYNASGAWADMTLTGSDCVRVTITGKIVNVKVTGVPKKQGVTFFDDGNCLGHKAAGPLASPASFKPPKNIGSWKLTAK